GLPSAPRPDVSSIGKSCSWRPCAETSYVIHRNEGRRNQLSFSLRSNRHRRMTIPPWPTHTLPFSLVLLLDLGTHSHGLKAQPVPFDWHSAAIANNISGDDVRDIAVDTVNNFIYAVGVVHGNGPYGLQAYNGIPPLLQTPRRDGFLMK